MSKGYIRLHRQLQDCWVWKGERFSRGQAWVDLLLMANHKDVKIPFGDQIITIKRGQFVTSMAKLADKWEWSFNTVKRFLNLLENDNMLTRKSDNSKTLITIVNYDIYQYCEDENNEVVDRPLDRPIDRPTDGQGMNLLTDPLIPNNNDNNELNDRRNIYCSEFEKVYKAYPRKGDKKRAYSCYKARLKEGFSEEELLKATQNYADFCKKEHREEKYIKLASTFFGVNTPFVDYLKGGDDDDSGTETKQFTDEELEQYKKLL